MSSFHHARSLYRVQAWSGMLETQMWRKLLRQAAHLRLGCPAAAQAANRLYFAAERPSTAQIRKLLMQDWVGRYQLDAAAATAELLTLIAQVGIAAGQQSSCHAQQSCSSFDAELSRDPCASLCRQLAAMLKSPRRKQRTERWTRSSHGCWRLPRRWTHLHTGVPVACIGFFC